MNHKKPIKPEFPKDRLEEKYKYYNKTLIMVGFIGIILFFIILVGYFIHRYLS